MAAVEDFGRWSSVLLEIFYGFS